MESDETEMVVRICSPFIHRSVDVNDDLGGRTPLCVQFKETTPTVVTGVSTIDSVQNSTLENKDRIHQRTTLGIASRINSRL